MSGFFFSSYTSVSLSEILTRFWLDRSGERGPWHIHSCLQTTVSSRDQYKKVSAKSSARVGNVGQFVREQAPPVLPFCLSLLPLSPLSLLSGWFLNLFASSSLLSFSLSCLSLLSFCLSLLSLKWSGGEKTSVLHFT